MLPRPRLPPAPTTSACDGPRLRAAVAAQEPILSLECGAGLPNGVLSAINETYCAASSEDMDEGFGEGDPCYLLGGDFSVTAAVRALDALALAPSGRLDPDRHLPSFNVFGVIASACWRRARRASPATDAARRGRHLRRG